MDKKKTETKAPRINWKKLFSIVRKGKDYQDIITNHPSMDSHAYQIYSTSLLKSRENCEPYWDTIRSITHRKLHKAIAKRKSQGESLTISMLQNRSSHALNSDVINEILCRSAILLKKEVVEPHLPKRKLKGDRTIEVTLSRSKHPKKIKRLQELLLVLMKINNYADIPGIDDDLANALHRNMQSVYDLTTYYLAVLKFQKLPTGTKATLASNLLLLYLYLYIQSYGGLKHGEACQAIASLLELLDKRLTDISVEQRIIRAAHRILKKQPR